MMLIHFSFSDSLQNCAFGHLFLNRRQQCQCEQKGSFPSMCRHHMKYRVTCLHICCMLNCSNSSGFKDVAAAAGQVLASSDIFLSFIDMSTTFVLLLLHPDNWLIGASIDWIIYQIPLLHINTPPPQQFSAVAYFVVVLVSLLIVTYLNYILLHCCTPIKQTSVTVLQSLFLSHVLSTSFANSYVLSLSAPFTLFHL